MSTRLRRAFACVAVFGLSVGLAGCEKVPKAAPLPLDNSGPVKQAGPGPVPPRENPGKGTQTTAKSGD